MSTNVKEIVNQLSGSEFNLIGNRFLIIFHCQCCFLQTLIFIRVSLFASYPPQDVGFNLRLRTLTLF